MKDISKDFVSRFLVLVIRFAFVRLRRRLPKKTVFDVLRCVVKHRFSTQEACLEAIGPNPKIPLYAYICRYCFGWHKTRKKRNVPGKVTEHCELTILDGSEVHNLPAPSIASVSDLELHE